MRNPANYNAIGLSGEEYLPTLFYRFSARPRIL